MDNLLALADYFGVSLDYLAAGREAPAPEARPVINNYYYSGYHFEYKSRRTLFGLPLVHINVGVQPTLAVGIVAIGNTAVGVLSIGGLAFGLVALGGVAVGLLLAFAGVALGVVALGGLALGGLAVGGVALGYLTWGGIAGGVYGVGGIAAASRVAIGGLVRAPVAVGDQVEWGVQIFRSPLSPAQLSEARSAIDSAAPGWVACLLKLFLR